MDAEQKSPPALVSSGQLEIGAPLSLDRDPALCLKECKGSPYGVALDVESLQQDSLGR
jgi:hypothetical protein